MKVIIIEDEKLAQERLEELLSEIDPSIEILEKLESIEDSVKYLSIHTPDLIFLDIQLSDGICFSIFDRLQVKTPVIFTTAYDQYAIKAFKQNSIGYLLKPVRKESLKESLSKYKELRSGFLMDIEEILRGYQGKPAEYKERFLVQYGQKIRKVAVSEIAYFFAIEKNVFLTTFQNSQYPVDYSLDRLLEVLDPKKFFRINRKMLISFDSIKNLVPYSKSRIRLDLNPPPTFEPEVLVSVERTARFKEWMDA